MADFRPFCVRCLIRMRCKKNEVAVVHEDDYIQSGDLYQCPQCHTEVISGFGQPTLALGDGRLFALELHRTKKEWVYLEKRAAIFKPLGIEIARQLDIATGGTGENQ
jgi:hypothetical protein